MILIIPREKPSPWRAWCEFYRRGRFRRPFQISRPPWQRYQVTVEEERSLPACSSSSTMPGRAALTPSPPPATSLASLGEGAHAVTFRPPVVGAGFYANLTDVPTPSPDYYREGNEISYFSLSLIFGKMITRHKVLWVLVSILSKWIGGFWKIILKKCDYFSQHC